MFNVNLSIEWKDAYKQAITIVRESGWSGALVIDASAYAQNPDGKGLVKGIIEFF